VDNFKSSDNYLLSFILPSITHLDDLLRFIEFSKSETDWKVLDNDVYDGKRIVRIRVPMDEVDTNGNKTHAWMLGFGPFNFFPLTRQSPYFQIMLITKSKSFFKETYNKYSLTQHLQNAKDRGGDVYDAHLADIYIKTVTDNAEMDANLWGNSSKRKWQLLRKGGQEHDANAKAKVTFSYPVSDE
jgi:hypothetical protein